MENVLSLPRVPRAADQHRVQFYETDSFLADAVTRFLADGLRAGDPAIVVATPAHREAFAQRLGASGLDVAALLDRQQLVILDATDTLSQFMLAGTPRWERFAECVGGVVRRVQAAHPGRHILAYGEMVDILWRNGQQDAAIQLEQMWNDLREQSEFSLLCAYVIDSFYKETGIPQICATHSHVLPPEPRSSPGSSDKLEDSVRSLVAEIGRRIELEHALRESREDLEDFVTSAPVPIHRVDRDGIIRWANKAELQLLGYREDEYVGRHIAEFHVDRAVIDDILERLGRGETLVGHEARVRTKTGDILTLEISSNVQLKDGKFHTTRCFARDVTEVKRAEQHARSLHEAALAARLEAEQANRAKDEFLAILGHELRNPLSPILTAVQLMRVRGETSSAREQTIIERQVRHLIHIIDDLLDISRVARGKIQLEKRPLKLRALVTKAIEITSPLFEERRQHLAVRLPPEDIWLEADETRLCQVVANLLSNAAKYTPMHGHIAIEAAPRDGRLRLRVTDNGNGIAPELLPRIFDLFVQGHRTSDRQQGGLGIGLSLVRNLVALHGGTVAVHSDGPGRGSEFVVDLPMIAAPGKSVPHDADGDLRRRVSMTARRILVVDDNEDACELLGEMLRSVGHEVAVATDGPRAIELVKTFSPEVAILDIGLPVMDGHELATQLRSRFMDKLRMIAVTGYGQEHDKKRALASGFDVHLVKPVSLQKVLAAIEVGSAVDPQSQA